MLSRNTPRCQIIEHTGDQQGITLVEILVSVVLLSLVSTIFLNLLVTAIGWNQLAADKTRATNYAVAVMEELRTVSSDFPVLCSYTYSYEQGNWMNRLKHCGGGGNEGWWPYKLMKQLPVIQSKGVGGVGLSRKTAGGYSG